jgi:membrane-bound metal-dependent hydrolase YbcI (DUF457 family)
MFIGHFGVALAAKRVAPRVSLGTTIFATCLLDAIWPLLVIAGIERLEIAPGITKMTPLDFIHYPWSHSLLMAVVWGVAFAAVYWWLRGRPRDAVLVGAIVVSHWLLDWITHRPDLPLYPGDAGRHGLGLWNAPAVELPLEAAIFAAGIYLYLSSTRARDRTGTIAFWALVVVLLASFGGAVFGPPPPSAKIVAYSGLIGYLMVAWGYWIDRHRDPVAAPR